jgi:hypothetical protein
VRVFRATGAMDSAFDFDLRGYQKVLGSNPRWLAQILGNFVFGQFLDNFVAFFV